MTHAFYKIGLAVSALILGPVVTMAPVFGSGGTIAAVMNMVVVWYFLIQVIWHWEPKGGTR